MELLKFVFLIVLLSFVCGEEVVTYNQAAEDQNLCILRHMIYSYTESDNVTLSNTVKLFDAVTVGYHDSAPADHRVPPTEEEEEDDEHGHRHKKKREIHMAGVAGGTKGGGRYVGKEICDHELEDTLHECVPGSTILQRRGFFNFTDDTLLTVEDFQSLCPALLFQLTMTPCIYHPHTFLVEKTTSMPKSATNTRPYLGSNLAWVGAVTAVVVISLCGLAIISVIPAIKKSFYQQAIQFLVALAVGTLVGDALLHLLPHALSEHEEAETDLRSSSFHVWRASVSLLGIYIFFNAERILGIITSMKRDKKKLQKNRAEGISSQEDTRSDAGSCGSCAEVPYVTGHTSHAGSARSKSLNEIRGLANEEHKAMHASTHTPCRQSTELVNLVDHSQDVSRPSQSKSCQLPSIKEKSGSSAHVSMPLLSQHLNNNGKNHSSNAAQTMGSSTTAPLIRGAEPSSPVKLSHDTSTDSPSKSSVEEEDMLEGHGHSHSVPNSCSSVAYMVIMGDGLHNFTDGLAIGAAFASSFAGGMSTSLAVLCHELPHELGDFAMLLKTGMSLKQAYMCNLLSASLQCLGVVIGVLIGNVTAASQWLFAFAGGIFLYVGLVDMLPEITKVDHKHVWKQLLLQNLGLLCGFTFMLLIAAFETNIERVFVVE